MNRRLGILVALLGPVTFSTGCGLEELLMEAIVGDPATPAAGEIPEGSAQLRGTVVGAPGEITLSFYSAQGVALEPHSVDINYSTEPVAWQAILVPDDRLFNVRVVAESGGVVLKGIVADPFEAEITTVPALDALSTTLALALEVKPVSLEGIPPEATPTPTALPTPTAGARIAVEATDGAPALGSHPCEGVRNFTDALSGQIATGTGPAAALYEAVSAAITDRATPWTAVVANAAELGQTLGPLALAAAESASTDATLDPSLIRVYFGVVRIADYPDFKCKPVNIDKWVNPDPGDHMFFTGGIHEESPLQDAVIQTEVLPNWVPNILSMYDDATHGDEVARDNIWTLSFALPRTMRLGYKFTYGAQGESWTGTEEWPGNQRILELVDVNGDGYVARFDVFGDEKSNKDKQNLYSGGGTNVSWDTDLNADGYPEPQEQPADFVGGDCVLDGFWQPMTLPPVTTEGCF